MNNPIHIFSKVLKISIGLFLVIIVYGCSTDLSQLTGSLSTDTNIIKEDISEKELDELIQSQQDIDFPLWKQNRGEFSIAFTGDVMLGRYVEELSNRNGIDYPFEEVRSTLDVFDEIVINLEGPILRSEDHVKTPDFVTNFSFHEQVAENLRANNIGIANLANNHTFDKGETGYEKTIEILEENEIDWFGHPNSYSNEYVLDFSADGLDVNLLGYHQATNSAFSINEMKDSIQEVVNSNPRSLNIANFHFGPEYNKNSAQIQKNIARAAVDAGADMVIGHHPHVVQEMEIYKGKPIFYSLGNFIFDQYFSEDTQEGLLVELVVDFKDLRNNQLDLKNDPYVLLGGKYEVEKFGINLWPLKSKASQPYFLGEPENTTWINQYLERSNVRPESDNYIYEWSY